MSEQKLLIDANALIHRLCAERDEVKIEHAFDIGYHNGLNMAVSMAINAPTVDAVEVVHGHMRHVFYSYQKDHYECTCCNGTFLTENAKYWHYCPNCGAKMDGDGNG